MNSRTISRRRSKGDLRQTLLDAGVALVYEEGLRGGVVGITFARVFELIERDTGERITAGSVYKRIWDDQRTYQLDVLSEAARRYPEDFEAHLAVMQSSMSGAAESIGQRDGATNAERLQALCRAAAGASLALLQTSRSWVLWMAVFACTASTPEVDDDDAVIEPIRSGFRSTEALFEPFMSALSDLGIQPMTPQSHREFLVHAASTLEGVALRTRFVPQRSDAFNLHEDSVRRERNLSYFSEVLGALVRTHFSVTPATAAV